jgi:hypothetical protein
VCVKSKDPPPWQSLIVDRYSRPLSTAYIGFGSAVLLRVLALVLYADLGYYLDASSNLPCLLLFLYIRYPGQVRVYIRHTHTPVTDARHSIRHPLVQAPPQVARTRPRIYDHRPDHHRSVTKYDAVCLSL